MDTNWYGMPFSTFVKKDMRRKIGRKFSTLIFHTSFEKSFDWG